MIVLTAVAVLVLLPIGAVVASALARSGGVLGVAGPVVLGVLGLGLLAVLVWAFFRVFRGGADLCGTEVTVRGAFRTRRVDLATAQMLRVANANSGWTAMPQVPILEAYDDAQGRSAMVIFGTARSGYLPLPEVETLVSATRAGMRAGVAAQQVESAVRELYLRACAPQPQPLQ